VVDAFSRKFRDPRAKRVSQLSLRENSRCKSAKIAEEASVLKIVRASRKVTASARILQSSNLQQFTILGSASILFRILETSEYREFIFNKQETFDE